MEFKMRGEEPDGINVDACADIDEEKRRDIALGPYPSQALSAYLTRLREISENMQHVFH
jgi:hypothetical protein